MAAAMVVSASTGAMNSVIGKLTSLLADEYQLLGSVKRGIRFLRDELSSMNAVLQRLADMEEDQIDPQTMEWRNNIRELSYDIEDCIDRFMLRASSGDTKANFLRKAKQKIKAVWEDHKIAKEIQELKVLVEEEDKRRRRYNIDQSIPVTQYVPVDPRATAIYEEAKNLVGIDGPQEKITGWLKGGSTQLRVVSIYGVGGLGKTTLAKEVYDKIEGSFDCRAFISVSRKPEIKKLLRDILFQINRKDFDSSEKWDKEQLIPTLRNYLKDNRYMIIVDDIWDIPAWKQVKSALPSNKKGSIIITTTRIQDVAESCCFDLDGLVYKLRPLSECDSRKLFFRRIFPSSEDCPLELRKVTQEILNKCGGLPLAIISISSLLASKDPSEDTWVKIQKTISSNVEKASPVAEMERILLLSYFDLSLHLRTCMLYLSVFPEDSRIDTRLLKWSWIAEGLVIGQNREDMEQAGESYLNQLINRSMIQLEPIGSEFDDIIFCKVHDVIHDMIISRASKENFVTVFGNGFRENYSNKFRRLSLQHSFCEAVELPKAKMNGSHLRSLHIFGSVSLPGRKPGKPVPQLLNCQALRMLNIEDNGKLMKCHIEHIGSFSQLKYLRMWTSSISELPEQIGELHNLETLELRDNEYIKKLPENIVQLRKLVRLFVSRDVSLPDRIGNMQSLEELSDFGVDRASIRCIQGLSELAKLRVLKIYFSGDKDQKKAGSLSSSISKLATCGLESLHVIGCTIVSLMISCHVQPPITPSLPKLFLISCELRNIPSQIGSLVNLTQLYIHRVEEVDEEGFHILAGLPKLLHLHLISLYRRGRQVICSQAFGCLRKLSLRYLTAEFSDLRGEVLRFEPGAMPKLQSLELTLIARGQSGTDISLGLHHLLALRDISVKINCDGARGEEVRALEDDIRGAAADLPNRPALKISRVFEGLMIK